MSQWSDDVSLEAMAQDVLELLDDAGLERAALCGHSLGGKVAMVAALSAPERVSSLIIADIAPVTYGPNDAGWGSNVAVMEALSALPGTALADRKDADQALGAAGIADAGIRAFLLQNLVPEERRWRFNLPVLKRSFGTVFAGFPELPAAPMTVPVRVIAGAKSTYCHTPEHIAAVEHFFPGMETQGAHFLDAGHWLHAERPKEFGDLVEDFLE